MARTFKLVSGTDEVDLINTADPGIIFRRGGAGPNRVRNQLTFSSSSLADGANLKLKNTIPVAERYKLNLKGSSHDNVASQLQALERILRKGDQNALTTWQQDPLYVQQQTTNETNARYSKILAWNGMELSDFFAPPIEGDSQIDDFEITIAREPYWRGTAPGVMPTIESVRHADFPWFNSLVGNRVGFSTSVASAMGSSGWGSEWAVDGLGSEIYGVDPTPSAETILTLEFYFDPNSIVMVDGDLVTLVRTPSPGGGDVAYAATLALVGTDYKLALLAKTDVGGNVNLTAQTLSDGPVLVRIEWAAASAPAANDGSLELFLDDVSKVSNTTIDNDTHNITDIRVGAVIMFDAGTVGTFYLDRIRWDDALDPSTWENTIAFEGTTTAPLPNYRQSTGVISHIYAEDNSATGFSANLVAEPSFEWFVVSGSTPAANDAMYFGADEPFYNLVFKFLGGHDINIAFDIEYSDGGSGWVALPTGGFNAQYFTKDYIGITALTLAGDPAWAADTVNAIGSKFWIRIILTTVTDWTTAPEQTDQIVYTANSPYLEFNNLQVHGDVTALMLQRMICYNSRQGVFDDPETTSITNVVMGMKSRGLDNFFSRFNCGGDNPTNWTESLLNNTTQDAKESSPGGTVATVDIKNSPAMLSRVKFDLAVGSQNPNDFEGDYRIYLRARQNGGSNGDISLRTKSVISISEFVTETVKMVDVDNDEIIDLGDLSLFSFGTLGDESPGALLFSIAIEASSESTGVTSLELYDMVLMPIDEMLVHASWSGKTNQFLQTSLGMKVDAGILREEAIMEHRPFQAAEEYQPFFTWQTKSTLPMLEPRRQARIYYLYWQDSQTPGTNISNQGQFLGTTTYLHERWNTLRGSD